MFEPQLREGGTYILMFLFVSFASQVSVHERRPLEMWALSFYTENPEVHKAAFKLLKIGTSSSCEHFFNVCHPEVFNTYINIQ